MNLPNTLTVSRLIAAVVVMLAMALPIPFSTTLAFVVFVVASITDYWDGRLARTHYGVTAFGKLMDPLADKVLVCAALVSFVGVRLECEPHYSLVPAWVVVVIIAREFAVTGLRLLAAASDRQRIRSLIDRVHAGYLDEPQIIEAAGSLLCFENVNTPEEFAAAELLA